MNKKVINLKNKVVKLHECSKKGNYKMGYKMFKEAMAAILELEANGVKSGVVKEAKAILSAYYNKYQATIAKDTTRVIVEAKQPTAAEAAKMAEKAEKKQHKETRERLKAHYKELQKNMKHLEFAINGDKDEHKSDYERVKFDAEQLMKIADKVKAEAGYWLQEDYLE